MTNHKKTIIVFITSEGENIISVEATERIKEKDIIRYNDVNVEWEHCNTDRCYAEDEDGICITEDGTACSEQHAIGNTSIN